MHNPLLDLSLEELKLALQKRIMEPQFLTWIKPLKIRSIDDDRIVLESENDFSAGWVQEKYLGVITEVLRETFQVSTSVAVEISSSLVTSDPWASLKLAQANRCG